MIRSGNPALNADDFRALSPAHVKNEMTLIWLYREMLRLFARLRSRD
ncbi:MAG: hypothetical protein AAB229_01170 [Candidatus Hydrogenedentota bacterium]